jgi:branched-chain amino acid transport system permease protein
VLFRGWGMAGPVASTTSVAAPGGRRRLARLPTRRVVQWALGIAVLGGASYGAYRTLQLGTFSAAAWRNLVVFGVAQGAIYAIIALGYTMVYGILKMINFAHGEVFTAGMFGSYFVARTLNTSGLMASNPVVAILILVLVAMLVSMGVAVLLERVAYRPLRNAPRLVPLITAIGASLFLQNTFRGFFGSQTRGYPTPDVLNGTWKILGVPILRSQVIVIVVAIVSLVGLSMFIARTKTGKSMRAVSEDREIAALMGIDVNRGIVTTFAIGGLLAGVAGVLFALVFEVVGPFIGFIPGIKAFTAAVLGGIGSIGGAALGGLILGLLESVGPALFLTGLGIPGPNQLKDVIAFAILVLVLIFRPGGILGTGEAEKV